MGGTEEKKMNLSSERSQQAASGIQRFSLNPGNLIITEFSKFGGVKYERSDSAEPTKVIDNQSLYEISNRIISDCHYIMETSTAKTPIGWYATDEGLIAAIERIAGKQEEAALLNKIAEKQGSERRVIIKLYPVAFPVTEEITQRILEYTIEWLLYVKSGLLAGSQRDMGRGIDLLLNMHQYARGIYASELREAVVIARKLKTDLGKAIRSGESPERAHLKLADVGSYAAIVELFTSALEPKKVH